MHVPWPDFIVLFLVIFCIGLDLAFPCNKWVKVILTVVVILKIIIIARYSKKKGEKEGEEKEKKLLEKGRGNS
jgi:hypothetical protein